MREVMWMVTFGCGSHLWDISPPRFGEVVVVKRTAKQVQLEKCNEFSGYRTRVGIDELYATRELAVAAASKRAKQAAEYHMIQALKFKESLGL